MYYVPVSYLHISKLKAFFFLWTKTLREDYDNLIWLKFLLLLFVCFLTFSTEIIFQCTEILLILHIVEDLGTENPAVANVSKATWMM